MFEVRFEARIWLYEGAGSWHFVTLPVKVSAEILALAAGRMKPGGSLRVAAIIGDTRWKTSIFRDARRNTFLLPVKTSVRVKEQLRAGDAVEVVLIDDQGASGQR